MARVYGMKSCMSVVSARIHRENWRECTYEETLRLRLNVKEDEREARRKTDPEDDQARYKPHERRDRREVAERLSSEESRERVLFHGTIAVLFLRVEHVRDLCHDTHFTDSLGILGTVEGERVDTQGRGEVDLVVLVRAHSADRGKVSEVNSLGRFNEVLARNGGGTRDDRRCPRGTPGIEKSGGPA